MKSAAPDAVQVISYGGVTARVSRRGNGMFVVRWREAKKGRSTTSTTREGALELAKTKVRELAGKAGSRMVSVIEAEAVEGLKGIIGARSLSAAVDQLKDAVQRTGGWEHLGKAVDGYLKAGHGKILRTPMSEAVPRFLLLHSTSAALYLAGLRKELEAFVASYGDLAVCDVGEALLRSWISRPNQDGTAPGARFFNNRLGTWKTFLNRCREWNMLAREGQNAGETIKRQKEEDRVPEIWTVDQARKALKAVLAEEPQSLAYLVLGCWMGLRPFEMYRLTWAAFDWERGYLDVGADVALKTMSQRFVPMPENALNLLRPLSEDPRWGVSFKRKAKRCVRKKDQVHLQALLKRKGIIKTWPQDVMRHSYISYRLAQGHGRGQVAEWAGNSESVIRQSYRRPLRKEDGDEWFSIGLPPPPNSSTRSKSRL